ncbi:rod shape-determining protein MreC [Olivibacter sitiensis]|uniref:rod shape-determining protein MreC n=1 Tax=Olivibacter sitiensis TaxID=376470 RepID=UPI0003F79046|nr:rod shape-determining protein MreC [Olivibacter sitiensis]
MKNIWIFIGKYNAFFLFLLFFGFSLFLVIRNNIYQRSYAFNSANLIVGSIYAHVNEFTKYFNLGKANDRLANENAALREQLRQSLYSNIVDEHQVNDSLYDQRYSYIVARVINNSVHQKSNYITIDRGSLHGIQKGMGVISADGVVGIVLNVSPHFTTIQSVLHPDTRISATLDTVNAFGSLIWGGKIVDPTKAALRDIPNHVKVKEGEKVVTTGYSLFPSHIPIGKVIKSDMSGDSFLDIEVLLDTDFSTLQYVYVVLDKMSDEKQELEKLNTENE